MKFVKYTKYTGDPASELNMEDLLSALSDYLLDSGFHNQYFDFSEMDKDIVKRPFITIGLTALLMLIPLAVTSTNGWVRRLGFKRWQKLHRLVYLIALLGVIHYYWLVKSDVRLPLLYGAIWAALMISRVVDWRRKRPAPAT